MDQLKTNFTEAFILHVELLQGVVLPADTLETHTLRSRHYLLIAQTETIIRAYLYNYKAVVSSRAPGGQAWF